MLEGIIRESTGKKATKALRQDGYLIANIYGKGLENINAAFKKIDFIKAMRAKTTFTFEAKIGNKTHTLAIQEYQKDPINYDLLHIDLIAVQPKVVTFYQVPVRILGEAIGIKNKGVLMQYRKRIKIKSSIENAPDAIELDVSNLDVGDNILVKDLNLGDKITVCIGDTVPVVGVIKAK
ncbi:LSU ribosomal protein L25p [hydrothermal vent metagenome]|uniref:LSU ribosomal protein L25p n=1 Tax=hydrothermal vent metagenome TaxID=652676 RepID=A0A3B1E8X7_9ZZZZ